MPSGIKTKDNVAFRIAGAVNDRIGIGILNKTSPKDHVSGPESFPFFSICMVMRGSGSYQDSATGMRYPINAGMFFLRLPGVEHTIRIDTSSDWLEYFIDTGAFAWPYFKNYYSLSPDCPVGDFDASKEWINEFKRLLMEIRECSEDRLPDIHLQLLSLASRCVRGIHRRSREEEITHKACMYLGSDFSEHKDIRKFCRENGWGYENFRRIFTRIMEISPNRYRIQRRMDTARVLLVQKELSIAAISETLGYCNPYEFSNKFKAFFGMPPSEFRKHHDQNTLFKGSSISKPAK